MGFAKIGQFLEQVCDISLHVGRRNGNGSLETLQIRLEEPFHHAALPVDGIEWVFEVGKQIGAPGVSDGRITIDVVPRCKAPVEYGNIPMKPC